MLALCALALGCTADPKDPRTWIKKLADPSTQSEAVGQLVALKDKRAVGPLIDLYRKSKSPDHLKAIISFADPSAVPVLIESLEYDEGHFENAVLAATTLGELGDTSAVEGLIKAALKPLPPKTKANLARVEAMNALSKIKDRRAVDCFVTILSTPAEQQDFQLNKLAARALVDMPDPKAVPALIRGLFMSDRGSDVHAPCRIALVAIGEPAVDKLIEAMQRKFTELEQDAKQQDFFAGIIVQKTSSILGDIHSKKAVPALLEELGKTDDGLAQSLVGKGVSGHQSVIIALGRIGDPSVGQTLIGILSDGKRNYRHRAAAAEALNLLGDASALPALAAATKTKWLSGKTIDPDAASLVAQALTSYSRLADANSPKIGIELPKDLVASDLGMAAQNAQSRVEVAKKCNENMDCYAQFLEGADPIKAEKAAFMLSRMGRPALPTLVKRVGHREPRVRMAILFGIGRLADRSCFECISALNRQILEDSKKDRAMQYMADEMRAVRAQIMH